MKKISKSLGFFAVAFAMCMLFAFGVKVNAEETKMQEGIAGKDAVELVPLVTDISRANFAISSTSYSVSNSNYFRVQGIAPVDADYVEIGVFDYKNQFVKSKEAYCYSNGQFSGSVEGLGKNKVYYIRVRTIQKVSYQNTYGNWSEPRAIVFLKNKAKEYENYRGNYETLTVKTKKIKGVKKYKVQVSKNRDKGYKKVKTIKAGKKITVSKYKGKRLKLGKTWYIRVIPVLNTKTPVDIWAIYYI